MTHGGPRYGTPGRAYANRSDMNTQPIRTAPSQHYGDRAANERAQQAAPLPQSPAIAALMQMRGAPPDHPGLFRDTERPTEPVHAGLPIGPGPGPDMSTALTARDLLEAIGRKYPNPDLDALIQGLY